MWKKLILLLAALLLLPLSHLRPCYKVAVNRRELPGLYTAAEIRKASQAACRAGEEILRTEGSAPLLSRSCRLSLRPAEGDGALLTHSLLMARPGIELADAVSVNGITLGTVEDGELLLEKLRSYIRSQMPNAAVFGGISGQVEIKRVYSCPGRLTADSDMVLLISGVAPVFYVDGQGKLA